MSHNLHQIGVFKASPFQIENINRVRVRTVPTKVDGYYFVDAGPMYIRKILANNDINYMAIINTDYFGGCGSQDAIVFNLTVDYRDRERPIQFRKINDALSMIGLESTEENDAFDEIGLSLYRTNEEMGF